MKWSSVDLMSKAKLSEMLGVFLIDLDKELENYAT